MEHILEYKQCKSVIDGLLPEGSHTFVSLVEMFQECDDQFYHLISEKASLTEKRDLAISASEILDAYELVENGMINMCRLISKVGMDESNKLHDYDVSEYASKTKEIIPTLSSLIYEVSSHISDFLAVYKGFEYDGVDSLNPMHVRKYMEANSLISKISSKVRKLATEIHSGLSGNISEIESDLDHMSMKAHVFESVKGTCYVGLIDGITIIEVGKTEKEAKDRTMEYFDGDVSDDIKIMPCSNGVYDMVTNRGIIPEEWDEVDGVIVLPEEKEFFEKNK